MECQFKKSLLSSRKRDGMGREVGGGFRLGNTCIPMVDSCQCMTKALQDGKVIIDR